MRTKRLRMRKMRTRRLRTRRLRTKNNRRKGGANTTRKAIMQGKINLLKAKCKANYIQKEVDNQLNKIDNQLNKIEKKLEEIIYQQEKLELKKQALTDCRYANGIKESSGSFTRVAVPHAKVIQKRESPKFVDGFGFPSESASYLSVGEESF